jgi:hypothetical protein
VVLPLPGERVPGVHATGAPGREAASQDLDTPDPLAEEGMVLGIGLEELQPSQVELRPGPGQHGHLVARRFLANGQDFPVPAALDPGIRRSSRTGNRSVYGDLQVVYRPRSGPPGTASWPGGGSR